MRLILCFLFIFNIAFAKPKKSKPTIKVKKKKSLTLTQLTDQVDSRCKVIKKRSTRMNCLRAYKKAYKKKVLSMVENLSQDPKYRKKILTKAYRDIDKLIMK